MGQYNFYKDGQITSLDGVVIGHIEDSGELRLDVETLRVNVLKDLQHQVQNDQSFEWPQGMLAAARIPQTEWKGLIRLACTSCDTDEAEWIEKIPDDWELVTVFQSLEDSLHQIDENGRLTSSLEWYTHLGICPGCR